MRTIEKEILIQAKETPERRLTAHKYCEIDHVTWRVQPRPERHYSEKGDLPDCIFYIITL